MFPHAWSKGVPSCSTTFHPDVRVAGGVDHRVQVGVMRRQGVYGENVLFFYAYSLVNELSPKIDMMTGWFVSRWSTTTPLKK